MFPVVYDGPGDLAAGPTPGAEALRDFVVGYYPPAADLGIWAPRPVRGTTGIPSVHWTGRAVDIGYPGGENHPHPTGQRLAGDLVDNHAALGIQCVIYAGEIWSTRIPRWRAYGGVNGHWTHVHIELNRAAARSLTFSKVGRVLITKPPEVPVRPKGHKWSILDFSDVMINVHDLYDLYRGDGKDTAGRVVWGDDLAAKLFNGENPQATVEFVFWELRRQWTETQAGQ